MYHPGDVFNVCYIAVMRKLLQTVRVFIEIYAKNCIF